jgi:hypothetical protein
MLSSSRTFAGFAIATLGALMVAPWGCSSSDSTPGHIGYGVGDAATEPDSTVTVHPDSGADAVAATDSMTSADSATDSATSDAGEAGPAGGCHDNVIDGNETDVDCGGNSCPACPEGDLCAIGTDCTTDSCGSVTTDAGTELRCFPALCTDHIKNGNETDVDCGGGAPCSPCLVGKQCAVISDCASQICTNGVCACPPNMSVVPTSQTLGGSYCIDDFEVTKAAYTVFNSANPVLNLPAQCGTNPDYTPKNDWPAILTQTDYNGGEPVHYVNWCDAVAYCQYNNKHLCGAISGGAQDPSMANVYQTDAWYNACSAKGNNPWPYGSPYQSQWCNGADLLVNGVPTDSILPEVDVNGTNQEPQCQGGESFVYFMSGNVAEWENACDTASPPNCLARGGSYASSQADVQCTSAVSLPATTAVATIGFRCCD